MKITGVQSRVLLAVIFFSAVLTGCSADDAHYGIDGDRAKIYEDLDSMIADTDLIVTGTVREQIVTDDGNSGILPDTVSYFDVESVYMSAKLASETDVIAGATIHIHQYGSADTSAMFPLVKEGSTYLLFLVGPATETDFPSDDPRHSAYFITGQEAGLYQFSETAENGDVFARVNPDSGDQLPATLNPQEL